MAQAADSPMPSGRRRIQSGSPFRSLLACGDTVRSPSIEAVVIVDQVRQVLLERRVTENARPRGRQVLAAVRHVPAIPDRLDGGPHRWRALPMPGPPWF